MSWHTPKTNWIGADRFRTVVWTRIVGNLKYLADAAGIAYTPYDVVEVGTVLTSADYNVVTDLLEELCVALNASFNRGYVAPRVDYGSTWNSRELNIIESIMLGLKALVDGTATDTIEYYAGDEIVCGDTISVGLL